MRSYIKRSVNNLRITESMHRYTPDQ